MKIIYIASPYSIGDPGANVKAQLDTIHEIMDMGHVPIAPLLHHFAHIHKPRPYEEWLKIDLEIVKRVDIVLRLPGESFGADAEVAIADENEISVAYSMDELKWMLKKS